MKLLTLIWDWLLAILVVSSLTVFLCFAWVFGGRAWREFLSGRDLEHD